MRFAFNLAILSIVIMLGVIHATTPSLSSPIPSNTLLDYGQYVTYNTVLSGGTGPFVLNLTIDLYNTTVTVNTIDEPAGFSGPVLFTITPQSGVVTYNVMAEDTSDSYAFGSASNVLIVNTTLTADIPGPAYAVIDSGQSVALTAYPGGGTLPYASYQWYSGSSTTCASDSAISGATSQSYTAAPKSSTHYCYKVTDSASTPSQVYSNTSSIVVNPALGTPSISPSITPINGIVFGSVWSGGTSPYAAALYSSSTSSCNTNSKLLQQRIGLSSGAVTFIPVYQSSDTYYCIFVTDNSLSSSSAGSTSIQGLSRPTAIAVSPSGTFAYITNYGSNSLAIMSTASNSITSTITGFSQPMGVAFSPTGSFAYVTDYGNGDVSVVSTASNSIASTITGFSQPLGIAFSPTGSFAYATNYGSKQVSIISTSTNAITGSITSGFDAFAYGISFSPIGNYAYITNAGFSNNVVIVNTASNAVVGSVYTSLLSYPVGVAFSSDGSYAYVVNDGSNNVTILSAISNSIIGSIVGGFSSPYGIAFSHSGETAYVTNYGSNNVQIINVNQGVANSITSEIVLSGSTTTLPPAQNTTSTTTSTTSTSTTTTSSSTTTATTTVSSTTTAQSTTTSPTTTATQTTTAQQTTTTSPTTTTQSSGGGSTGGGGRWRRQHIRRRRRQTNSSAARRML